MTATPQKTKAFSYLRFSTPEQAQGDSFRRQSSMALAYAAAHDLEIDESVTYHDPGVSAYRGANAETGQLGAFLEAVKVGLVPQGSVLLVEALDRISRATARKALRVLEDIVDAGVAVVTLSDGKRYTSESLSEDPIQLLVALLLFVRGNEESATKARRLKAAWEGKRINALAKPLTSVTPAWIKLEGSQLDLIPDRAVIVRRIVAEALSGLSQQSIADRLNTDEVPRFGDAQYWHRTYINKVINNPALTGVYVPRQYVMDGPKRVRKPLEPIPGYYPRLISDEAFSDLQALQKTASAPRARATGTSSVQSLLGGLAVCPSCGGTMTRVVKGAKGGQPRLVCVRAKVGQGCKYVAVSLPQVEDALLSQVDSLIAECPSGVEGLDTELDRVDSDIAGTTDEIDNVVEALGISPNSAALAARLASLEAGLKELTKARQTVLDRISTGSSPVLARRLSDLKASLKAEPVDRPKINAMLRVLLRSVEVDHPNGQLVMGWKHGGTSSLTYAMPTV